jgi:hypothetical protein
VRTQKTYTVDYLTHKNKRTRVSVNSTSS